MSAGRDMARKRERERELTAQKRAAGIKRVPDSVRALSWTPEQAERHKERIRRRDLWRSAHKAYLKAIAAGPGLVARADAQDPGWRDAA